MLTHIFTFEKKMEKKKLHLQVAGSNPGGGRKKLHLEVAGSNPGGGRNLKPVTSGLDFAVCLRTID